VTGDVPSVGPLGAGLFGKVPGRGDFVTRRLPRAFLDPWDAWLQQGVAASREALGEIWLERYLEAPLWHFALAPDLCGPEAWTGVLMPSVDAVGRYFPLTIASVLPLDAAVALVPLESAAWHAEARRLALALLDDTADLEAIDRDIGALTVPPGVRIVPSAWDGDRIWNHGIGGTADLAPAYAALAASHLPVRGVSVWWTGGGPAVAPTLAFSPGLPRIAAMAALFDGQWDRGLLPVGGMAA
jgi:type VI secretion system protein ImpM